MTNVRGGLPLPLPDPPLAEGPTTLRPWAAGDADVLVSAWADPEIARWTGVPPTPDRPTATRWIAGDADRRAHGLSLDLVVVRDGAVVGEVGLVGFGLGRAAAEIGWWTSAAHRGRGSASTAAQLLAAWAVEELDVSAVVARCATANPASARVARAAGFRLARHDADSELWAFGPGAGGAILGA